MAKREDTPAKSGKGSIIKKILVWGVTGAVLVGLSVGGTLYLTGSLDKLGVEKPAVSPVTTAAAMTPATPAHYLALDPPLVINFDDQGLLRYLQVNISVMARDGALIEAAKNHLPHIRNNLIVLFSGQDFSMLSSVEGKEKLRTLALEEIQSILRKEIGAPGIEAVYFTNFVMQ